MYVAATRAKRWLVLSFAAERRKEARPSPYIAEMLKGLDDDQIRYHDAGTRTRLAAGPAGPEKAAGPLRLRPELSRDAGPRRGRRAGSRAARG